MRLLHSFFLTPFAAILIACGGGGGGSADPAPPNASTPPPSTSAEVSGTDHSSRVRIAALGDPVPAPGTTAALPVVSAGEIIINEIAMYVTFARLPDGRVYGLSDAAGTYLIAPADIERVCANSNQIGWDVPGYTSRSCGVPDENGYLQLSRTCNKDLVAWNVHLTDGRILWFDHTSERRWVRTGLSSTLRSDGLIEYGNYTPATVSANVGATVGGQPTADVTINFQNNCMGGFGKDNALTDLDPSLPIKYVWNSNRAGANYTSGWGLLPIDDRAVSIREAYAGYDEATGSYFVTFTGLACADRGNITVYKGTGPADAVVWDVGTDGFGAGWFVIQNASDPIQFWRPAAPLPSGVTLSFDRLTYQIDFRVPGCTAT